MNVKPLISGMAWSVLALMGTSEAIAHEPDQLACDPEVSKVESTKQLHEILARRSIEIVFEAMKHESDKELAGLISPSSQFSLGSGDVGRPMGEGISGARKFASELSAYSYEYFGWDYMDGPVDACSEQISKVVFITKDGSGLGTVEFRYLGGILQSAYGWLRSRNHGKMLVGQTDNG